MKLCNYYFLICILSSASSLTFADDDDDHDRAKLLMESGEIISLENILKNARNVHPGRILEIELETKKNKLIYEIEILDTQGSVWELKFDAYSGDLIEKEKED